MFSVKIVLVLAKKFDWCKLWPFSEATGDHDRAIGSSAQGNPLLIHAPRLGRHPRWAACLQQLYTVRYCATSVAKILFWVCVLSTAVQSSMPDFHAKMKNKLRTEAQGADTVVWLAISDAASKQPSGLFFQGQHLYKVCSYLSFSSSVGGNAAKQHIQINSTFVLLFFFFLK